MNENAFPLPPRSLIEHQDFVRSLAWSLVRDEHDADDAAQDAWLAYLKHPPAATGSLRAWFSTVTRNQVRNSSRVASRRAEREQNVARSEVDDSETELRDRLALQHKVVTAVMSLKEPYRNVILLAYYEGLSSAEIARRRDVPAGTVRAQVSRALQMLRDALDRGHDGDRKTWSVGLLACLPHGKTSAIMASPAMLVAAGVLVIATIGAGTWWMSTPSPTSEPLTLASAAQPAPASMPPATQLQPTGATAGVRTMVTPLALHHGGEEDLKNASLDELVETGRQIQILLRERLLTPDPALLTARPDLSSLPDVHVNRIWQAWSLGAQQNNLVGLRGAGAFLSFATGSQDYDDEPDLDLDQEFSSGFYGGTVGLVVSAGALKLSRAGMSRPGRIDDEVWEALLEPSRADENSIPAAFDTRLRTLQAKHRPGVVLGDTYFVRSVLSGEHDLLAAFEVLAKDEHSVTIAWRVLQHNAVPTRQRAVDRRPVVRAPPPELEALTTDELRARYQTVVQAAQGRILDLPKSLDPAIAKYAAQRDGGLARIAERGRFESILSIDGAGAYWSFTRRSNDYQQEAQIELQQGRFTSGFAGRDTGYVVGLGQVPLDSITSDGVIMGLESDRQKRVDFVRAIVPVREDEDRPDLGVSDHDRVRADELGLRLGAASKLGDSYLVRCIQPGKQDVLAAFQIVAQDAAALTIAWKILRQAPASR